ncbi:CRISPR-associated endonuclease Cas2 [Acetohalobium arabaticum]|uniref:CRISPR-associated endoribonuclease Cas2 n=1 Tax=Acetohalobium arabaticum (strain ATCC 49924 / DSM 5501 / Z-7288) TaxID=574087 RepID=D9QVU9_ACEAZ|nr:CRISPR-associated endonuclease Cas2 [Acetohalobium arabaticum]ADL12358.1 CRISPR-associated protein, Cas2 family [Acetohalobium arabaticum DSM 5501]
MFVVISYDISEDKRRNRIFKILKDFGTWIQYSVFECELEKKDYLKLRDRLQKVLDEDEDNIRFYFLCSKCEDEIERIGSESSPAQQSIII